MTTPDEHPIRSAFVLYRHRRQRQIEILAGHRYDIAIVATCTNGAMLAVWSDDNATGGSALREAPLPCEPIAPLLVTSVGAVTPVT